MKNAIGYIRISKENQSVHSLDDQERAIKNYCEYHKVNLLTLFKDDGECSDSFDRPDYIALEKFIRKHKGQVQYLVVLDHDRFSRNLPEALLKIESLEKKFGIKVLATNEPLDLDTSDPNVFMSRAFKYLMANSELFRIRERTSRGVRSALESGRFINKAPFGYLNKRDEQRKGIIVVDEERAFIIKKIFSDYLMGYPLKTITNDARKLGLTYKGNSAIPEILSNCTYAGLVKVPAYKNTPERYVKAIHSPIISEADYWRAQELLGNRKPNKSHPHKDVPLRGLLKCWCGSTMTASKSKGRSKYYTYYRCLVHDNLNIPAQDLHDKFEQILLHLNWTEEQVNYLLESVRQKFEENFSIKKKQIEAKNKEIIEVTKKIERLEERLMNEEIESDTYKKWFKKLSAEKATISYTIQALENSQDMKLEQFERLLPYCTRVSDIYHKSSIHQKHSLVRTWFQPTLVFEQGAFGTGFLHKSFTHNSLILKEKGLLFTKEPSNISEITPLRTRDGS